MQLVVLSRYNLYGYGFLSLLLWRLFSLLSGYPFSLFIRTLLVFAVVK